MDEKEQKQVLDAIAKSEDYGELVGFYVDFRDEKEQIKREMTERMNVPQALMDRIESRLLELFIDSNQESAKTKFGTAYKVAKSSARVADWNVLLEYIKKNDAFDLLVKNVAKEGVKARIEETGENVPGVDIATTQTIQIRRA